MHVEIDKFSGFCFGVIKAINKAGNILKNTETLYCLGDIVHNNMEIERLGRQGLITITEQEYYTMKDCKVLIRAHGQPPAIYEYANKNRIELIDATCPVVLNLQKKIRSSYKKNYDKNGQVVIFGKKGHAEIVALEGQINNKAIILESIDDVDKIDFSRPVSLYSQTTRSVDDFYRIVGKVKASMKPGITLEVNDTICRQVSNRVPRLRKFVVNYDLILFVAGKKSSNGNSLYSICKETNPNCYYISNISEIEREWFNGVKSVGISGATSTPIWLLEEVSEWVKETFK
ncbi:MAG: 4-hydroxy-3-methylbut-2-enyl diphosphate reductase [Prolixibacteraceae bacterium]|nr:4-hydroxy-3-methylbut-2-enyl diphosphate reductase [Prolixibacteraceae bacterium]